MCLVIQSCTTLCNPMNCSLPGSSVHGDSPGKNTDMGCHALLQGIFPNQGSNPGLPHCRWILCHLSHQRSPLILEWVAYSFPRGSTLRSSNFLLAIKISHIHRACTKTFVTALLVTGKKLATTWSSSTEQFFKVWFIHAKPHSSENEKITTPCININTP